MDITSVNSVTSSSSCDIDCHPFHIKVRSFTWLITLPPTNHLFHIKVCSFTWLITLPPTNTATLSWIQLVSCNYNVMTTVSPHPINYIMSLHLLASVPAPPCCNQFCHILIIFQSQWQSQSCNKLVCQYCIFKYYSSRERSSLRTSECDIKTVNWWQISNSHTEKHENLEKGVFCNSCIMPQLKWFPFYSLS